MYTIHLHITNKINYGDDMKPILNMVYDLLNKLILDVDDETKGMTAELLKSLVREAARGVTEGAISGNGGRDV